jgi:hypothetical protein
MQKRTSLIVIVVVALAALSVLYFFAPLNSSFYPKCIFKTTTGYSCPFCGMLRCLHSLTHGHVGTAFRYNAMFFMSLPVLVVGAARHWHIVPPTWTVSKWYKKNVTLKNVAIVLLAWWVLRNLLGV